jgi:hypothetical protein
MVPPPALADLAHSKRFTTPPTPLLSPLPRCIALRGRPPCHRTAGISFALLLLLSTPAEASRFEVDPDQWAAIGNVARDVHGIGRHAGAKLTRICPMAFAEDVKDECHAVQCYSRSSCRTLQSDAVSTSRLMLEGTNFNSLDAWKYLGRSTEARQRVAFPDLVDKSVHYSRNRLSLTPARSPDDWQPRGSRAHGRSTVGHTAAIAAWPRNLPKKETSETAMQPFLAAHTQQLRITIYTELCTSAPSTDTCYRLYTCTGHLLEPNPTRAARHVLLLELPHADALLPPSNLESRAALGHATDAHARRQRP